MRIFQLVILIPFAAGLLSLFIPRSLRKYGGFLAAFSGLSVFAGGILGLPFYRLAFSRVSGVFQAGVLPLSLVILTGVFGFLVALYSIGHFEGKASGYFWALFCWLLASASGVFLAAQMVVLIVAWGITGLILVLMMWQAGNTDIAKKTFIIVGGGDAFVLLGLAGLSIVAGKTDLSSVSVSLSHPLGWIIFISLVIASFTKAGAMPFHTWIPDTAKKAPVPVVAILPASLDKLLGIYLLKKAVIDWFIVSRQGNFILLFAGAVTIIAAVFMALAQHDLKRLLGYHAVSQVGYMVMGLGTGNPIGIAGGLLHMVNNAIYKQSLFLGAGVIEKRTGTSRLEDLGSLAKNFPVTFIGFLIGSLSISGIPPFNGFVSKWLVYQGVVEMGNKGGVLWVVWLAAAFFGSALTLASFVKVLHAAFLGQPAKGAVKDKEKLLWEIPAMIILPLACIVIGIFPEYTVYPVLKAVIGPLALPGIWQPQLAAVLLVLGIGAGAGFYVLFKSAKYRVSQTYIGGEKVTPQMRVSGVEFYTTIENLGIFPKIYGLAKKGYFDIYEILKGFIFYWIRLLKWLHTGVLTTYVLWAMIGSALILFTIFR